MSFLTNIFLGRHTGSGYHQHVSCKPSNGSISSFLISSIAYGVMSIPAGFLAGAFCREARHRGVFPGRHSERLLSFAAFPSYAVAVASLFVMGGAQWLRCKSQSTPLLRVVGGEENFAFNSALAQLVFGVASFISPLLVLVPCPEPRKRGRPGTYSSSPACVGRRQVCLGVDVLDLCRMYGRDGDGCVSSSIAER